MTKPSRRLLQISCKPDFYEEIRAHCAGLDMPMTVWARELIKKGIAKHKNNEPSGV